MIAFIKNTFMGLLRGFEWIIKSVTIAILVYIISVSAISTAAYVAFSILGPVCYHWSFASLCLH